MSNTKRHNPDGDIPMNTKEEILQALRKVRADYHNDGYDFDYCVGICSNVDYAMYRLEFDDVNTYKVLRTLFETWSKYSGDHDYPVPCPDNDFSAEEAYLMVVDKWEGAYGELRVELLDHCISELEKFVLSMEAKL